MKITANLGAYLQLLTAIVPTLTVLMATGCYDLKNLDIECSGVFTNTMSTDAYRGAGRPEATFFLERAMDLVAQRLGLDPAEVRRKNFVRKEQFPYPTATGLLFDSGDYETTMDKALAASDYAGWRKRTGGTAESRAATSASGSRRTSRSAAWGRPRRLPGGGWESATVRVEPSGRVTVLTGVSPHGQGQETTFAQIVADELGVPIDSMNVVHGDTDKVQYGLGTYGSRGTAVGGSAVMLAIQTIQEKAIKIAAHLWEANPADIAFREGTIGIKGDPGQTMSIAEVAAVAYAGATNSRRAWNRASTPRGASSRRTSSSRSARTSASSRSTRKTGEVQAAALRRGRRLRAADQPACWSKGRSTAASRRGWRKRCTRKSSTTNAAGS